MIAVASAVARSLGDQPTLSPFPATLETPGSRTSTMDEQSFRRFYERTARSLQAYLISATGSRTVAEDLLQESYFRIIRADIQVNDENHRRNYLFRIATNLLRDRHRRRRPETEELAEATDPADQAARIQQRSDLSRVLGELKPRERELLWLAYVEGMSHQEIAAALGLKTGSIRPLLFRARRSMAAVLQARGLTP